jgi:hypothetical protein
VAYGVINRSPFQCGYPRTVSKDSLPCEHHQRDPRWLQIGSASLLQAANDKIGPILFWRGGLRSRREVVPKKGRAGS